MNAKNTKTDAYKDFVSQKLSSVPPTGLPSVPPLGEHLFGFQDDVTRWALRRGRCAAFLDTGLGKTSVQLEWAKRVHEYTGQDVLILAPLAVAAQTVAEGARFGTEVTLCREASDVRAGLNITNYDRLHKFDAARFGGVVLDESSCVKNFNSKILSQLLASFSQTPFKLACSATPAPNDFTELGTHAEFLGICTRTEMLAEYFCHDGGDTQQWRLKGHARDKFWQWVSGWAAMVRRPSDLGWEDDGYILPGLEFHDHVIAADHTAVRGMGLLFAEEARSLTERRAAKKGSIGQRVEACAALVNSTPGPWVVWADLNAEGDALTKAIRGAIQVSGSDDIETKETRLTAFARGEARVLVSKVAICGWGLNWQHVNNMAFVGVNDSFEAQYQAIRRCYRFGQKNIVNVHVFSSELEGAVTRNIARKQADAEKMGEELSKWTRDAMRVAVKGQARQTNDYSARREMVIPEWLRTEEAA
jgi:superfamily II DNA or RNA helicase